MSKIFILIVMIVVIIGGIFWWQKDNINNLFFGDSPKEICNRDTDCACGVKIGTTECFFGNRKYVNTLIQCPDFCSGIDGKMKIKCVNNICIQTREYE